MKISCKKPLSIYLAIFSIAALAFAYISEYGFGLVPCKLCLYQRIPYALVILVGFFSVLTDDNYKKQNYLSLVAGIIILLGGLTALYHVGVEQGIIITSACDQMTDNTNSIDEMRKLILETPQVACNKPQFIFLHLSMAAWNALISLLIALPSIVISLIRIRKTYGYNSKRS